MRPMSTICSILLAAVALEGSSAAATPNPPGYPTAHIRIDFSDRETGDPGGIRMPHVSFSQAPGPRVSVPRALSGRLLQARTSTAT
jgi:hypothetical protein